MISINEREKFDVYSLYKVSSFQMGVVVHTCNERRTITSSQVTIWCGIYGTKVIGPYFSEDGSSNTVSVTGKRFRIMSSCFPKLGFGFSRTVQPYKQNKLQWSVFSGNYGKAWELKWNDSRCTSNLMVATWPILPSRFNGSKLNQQFIFQCWTKP